GEPGTGGNGAGLMSDTTPTVDEVPALARRVDQACDRFEAAWKAAATAPPPPLDDFLGDTPGPERSRLLRELIQLEVYYRRRRGEDCSPQDYRERFPDLDSTWLAEALAPPGRPAAAPPDGKPTCGDYELLGEIARGGMGVVY